MIAPAGCAGFESTDDSESTDEGSMENESMENDSMNEQLHG